MRPQKTSDSKMLETTLRCILKHGISVSTQVIANELGVSQATLFKRFGTKEALVHKALLQPISEHSIFIYLAKSPTKESVVTQLQSMSMALLHFFEDMLPCIMMLRSGGCDLPQIMKGEDTPPILMRRLLTKWVEALQEENRIRQISAEAFALALFGAIQHRAMRRHILHDQTMTNSDEEFVVRVVDLFWHGISQGES
jgi:AcrR family transcriptional regulator